MLLLRGCPALSQFRLEKLIYELQCAVPAIFSVHAEYLHIVQCQKALNAEQQALLDKLLTYGPEFAAQEVSGDSLLVIPRPGTVSP